VRARKLDGRIAIEIRDFGSGIPEEFQPHIFGKFAQAQNSGARNNEGAGLGLNLSRQLVELMQGEIGFSTKAGEGTVFFVHLQPYAEAAAVAEACRSEVA
jgi:signal transduction histidine kinase